MGVGTEENVMLYDDTLARKSPPSSDNAGAGTFTAAAVGVARSLMTSGLFHTEPTKAYCGDCCGKGFDLSTGRRHARKCQRCRGKGFTTVGKTKR